MRFSLFKANAARLGESHSSERLPVSRQPSTDEFRPWHITHLSRQSSHRLLSALGDTGLPVGAGDIILDMLFTTQGTDPDEL